MLQNKMKFAGTAILLVIAIALTNKLIYSQTIINSDITTNTIWTKANSPYLVTVNIQVRNSATLTIQAGVTVQFAVGTNLQISTGVAGWYYGYLQAIGTASEPIVLMSQNGQSGGWAGILLYIGCMSGGGSTELQYCVIENATRNLEIQSSSPAISDCTIKKASGEGIYLNNSSSIIKNTTFTDNAMYGINSDTYYDPSSPPIILNCTFNGSSGVPARLRSSTKVQNSNFYYSVKNYIEYIGDVTVDAIWTKHAGTNFGYLIRENIQVRNSATLTIQPGVKIQFATGKNLQISTGVAGSYYGYLQAIGTVANPIIFTSQNGLFGGWTGILLYIGCMTGSGSTELQYCVIEKATRNLEIQSSSPTISDCVIKEASGEGIYLNNSSSIIKNTILTDNGTYGINTETYYDPSPPTILNCTFNGSTGLPARIRSSTNLQSCNFNYTSKNFVELAGNVTSTTIWAKHTGINFGYLIRENIQVLNGATLTIQPGIEIQFATGKNLQISTGVAGAYYGYLQAIGTLSEPIVFTSQNGLSGGWNGLLLYIGCMTGGLTELQYCVIENATRNLEIQSSSPTISNCTIRNATGDGIYLYNSNSLIKGCIISGNGQNGITLDNSSQPTIGGSPTNGNDIINNAGYAINNKNYKDVTATYNWWGTTNSAIIDSKIYDYYDYQYYGKVIYSPFLSSSITNPTKTYTLNISSSPSNGGTVQVNPNQNTFNAGSTAQLTATPQSGWNFSKWSGDTTTTANPITVTMYKDKNIVAEFIVATLPKLDLNPISPAGEQVKDWNNSVTYNINTRELTSQLVGNVTINITDDLKGTTETIYSDGAGSASYTTTVPNLKTNGLYSIRFTASKNGYTNSDEVVRNVRVSHTSTRSMTKVSGDNQTGQVNTTLPSPCKVVIKDDQGIPVSNVTVDFILAPPSGASGQYLNPWSTTTNSNGEASTTLTFGDKTGTYTVTAKSTGLSDVSFTATATSAGVATMTKSSGDNQTGEVFTSLSTPFEVVLRNASGQPVPNTLVNFSIDSQPSGTSGASLSLLSGQTNTQGRVSTILRLGTKAGIYSVRVQSFNLPDVTFTATAYPSRPSQLLKYAGDNQTGAINTTLPTPIEVVIVDSYNNAVPDVWVDFILAPPAGATGQNLSVWGMKTNAYGRVATVCTLGSAVGQYIVTAKSSGFSDVKFSATATQQQTGPILIAAISTPGTARNIILGGQYLFVAALKGGISIVDISTPRNPKLIKTFTTQKPVNKVIQHNNFIIACEADANYKGAIEVFDVSNPYLPSLKSTVNVNYGITDAVRNAQTNTWLFANVYIVSEYQLSASGILTGTGNSISNFTDAFRLYKYGYALFVADRNVGLKKYNVNSMSNPVLEIERSLVNSWFTSMQGISDHILVGVDALGVLRFDTQDLSELSVESGSPNSVTNDLVVVGNKCYVAAGQYGIRVLDISNSNYIIYSSKISTNGFVSSVTSDNKLLFVAFEDANKGIAIYDITASIGVDDKTESIPDKFVLYQNYPNPFNTSTTIEYSIPEGSHVKIDIYNSLGQKLFTVVDTYKETGRHYEIIDMSSLPQGVYFYRMTVRNNSSIHKMILY